MQQLEEIKGNHIASKLYYHHYQQEILHLGIMIFHNYLQKDLKKQKLAQKVKDMLKNLKENSELKEKGTEMEMIDPRQTPVANFSVASKKLE